MMTAHQIAGWGMIVCGLGFMACGVWFIVLGRRANRREARDRVLSELFD
jgi:hypothetical protein